MPKTQTVNPKQNRLEVYPDTLWTLKEFKAHIFNKYRIDLFLKDIGEEIFSKVDMGALEKQIVDKYRT